MRKSIIAGNWKMNKTIGEAVTLSKELDKLVGGINDRLVIVCPPFTSISAVQANLKTSNIKVGAQNMHFATEGAYTGEVSPLMLNEIGIKYVILGHSERRQIFKEDDKLINAKIRSAIDNKLTAIFCVGETLKEREANKTKQVVGEQITQGLENIKRIRDVIIAYEPVWAIGTGKTATPEQAEEVHGFIRDLLQSIFNSIGTSILYGGSVKPENIKELMAKDNIDGALVGGASLNAKSFAEIIKC